VGLVCSMLLIICDRTTRLNKMVMDSNTGEPIVKVCREGNSLFIQIKHCCHNERKITEVVDYNVAFKIFSKLFDLLRMSLKLTLQCEAVIPLQLNPIYEV